MNLAAPTPQQIAEFRRADALVKTGLYREAAEIFAALRQSRPNDPYLLAELGTAWLYAGDNPQAAAYLTQSLDLLPDQPNGHCNLGVALSNLGQAEAALLSLERSLALQPDFAPAHYNRGNALRDLQRHNEAVGAYDRAIALDSAYVFAYINRGLAYQELEHYLNAQTDFQRAIALQPDSAAAHYNLGNTLLSLKQLPEALASYRQAISLQPDYLEAYRGMGLVSLELKLYQQALECFEKCLAIQPDLEVNFNQGLALFGLNRYQEALKILDYALEQQPDHAIGYNLRGIVLSYLKLPEEAESSYQRAISLNPDFLDAYFNLGHVQIVLKQYRAAIYSYEQALRLQPDCEFLKGYRQLSKMQICDWQDFEQEQADIAAQIAAGKQAVTAFTALTLFDDPGLQRRAAEIWTAAMYPVHQVLPPVMGYTGHARIRIGYFSADFRNHPVAFLLAELFEQHDRSRFEIIGFSFGPDTQDDMRRRLQVGFDRFLDVQEKSDQEIAQLARTLEIDIAIDLGGHTADSRPGIFAQRAAPVQAAYLGYPGTLGSTFMDYLLADKVLISDANRQHYAEKIVYLPGSYMVSDSQRPISTINFSRFQMGLPESGFVFCSFNNHYKITPPVFACWMRILKAVAGSVLWLSGAQEAVENLRREAVQQGVAAERLVFARRLPDMGEHLSRQRLADLFLDTWPYNAHTTASDALWVGLPVLTCPGQTFAGRVAASLLTAIDMPELIADSPTSYERLAIQLGNDKQKLAEIGSRLAANRLKTPLFDFNGFRLNIEAAYKEIHRRQMAGLPLDDIFI